VIGAKESIADIARSILSAHEEGLSEAKLIDKIVERTGVSEGYAEDVIDKLVDNGDFIRNAVDGHLEPS